MKTKKKFYAVATGRKPGIYNTWTGNNGAQAQVSGYPGARYKGFPTKEEARQWLDDGAKQTNSTHTKKSTKTSHPTPDTDIKQELETGKVIIYTDGGCIDNPGPGGYGVVLLYGDKRKELSEGYRHTTNNRMELTACVKGLEALKATSAVIIFSDSKYVVNGINLGWAKKWRRKAWMRNAKEPAENPDLWAKLLDLCDTHEVRFNWVKGHAGNKENERCDQLATQASADSKNHLTDTHFESGKTPGNKELFVL
jgi:ribonuclease HI